MTETRPTHRSFPLGRTIAVLIASLLLMVVAEPALSQTSYILDVRDNTLRIPAPQPYEYYASIDDIGLRQPEHMVIDEDDNIYVADMFLHRGSVVKLDPDFRVVQVFGDQPGEGKLSRPNGVFVDSDGHVWVADTGNRRIVEFSPEGDVLRILTRDDLGPVIETMAGDGFDYGPQRLVIQGGFIYVINSTMGYNGMMQLRMNGQFVQFFAGIHLGFSPMRFLQNLLFTEAQRARLIREIPTAHSGVTLSPQSEIYAVSMYERTDQIKRLNVIGENTYAIGSGIFGRDRNFFGELRVRDFRVVYPRFGDLTVNEYGIVSALELGTRRIYQYSPEGDLLAVFGGGGSGRTQFDLPVSVAEDSRGRFYVLDKSSREIRVLQPTEYITLIHRATRYYMEGEYDKSSELWRQVTALNANLQLAQRSIGEALHRDGEYREAMENFRLADDRVGYSRSYERLRRQWVMANFDRVALALAGTILAIVVLVRFFGWLLSMKGKGLPLPLEFLRTCVEFLRHPDRAMEDMKTKGSLAFAGILILLMVVLRLASVVLTGFPLQGVDPRDTSLALELARVLGVYLLWTFVCYKLLSIWEGKSDLKTVAVTTAYCILPYVVLVPILTALSRVATLSEAGIFSALGATVFLWVLYLAYRMLMVQNEFTFGKATAAAFTTVFGVLVVIAGFGVLYTLINEMRSVVVGIIEELSMV